MFSYGCTVSPQRHALQWKVETSVRSVACQCTAGGISSEYVNGGECHPQWSRVVSCACTAPEAWADCWYSFWAPLRLGARSREVLRWQIYCGIKAGETFRVGSFSGESCWICLQSRSLWNVITLSEWLLLVAPVFSLVSSCFYTPHLCQSRLYESKGGLHIVLWMAGEAGCSLHHSHEENTSVAGKFLLGLEQCWL